MKMCAETGHVSYVQYLSVTHFMSRMYLSVYHMLYKGSSPLYLSGLVTATSTMLFP